MQDVFGLIFANYTGTDFGELLSKRTIASLPYAGRYRLVDFPLSNMVNSGIGTVGLIMPSNYRSLIDHVGSGKQWNLDKKIGGLFILPGTVYGTHGTTQKFTLSDIIVNHRYIERRSNQNYAMITSASKVCNVDYSDMIDRHIKSGRAVTFAYYKDGGELKPLDTFMVNRSVLVSIINGYAGYAHLDLVDLLTKELEPSEIGSYVFDDYVINIETIEDYVKASFCLLDPLLHKKIFRGENSIYTKIQDEPPTHYSDTASVKNSLVSAGCIIEGSIENCILFRNVRIEEGASLKNCIVFQHGTIESGAEITNAILDKYVTATRGVKLSGGERRPLIIEKNTVL